MDLNAGSNLTGMEDVDAVYEAQKIQGIADRLYLQQGAKVTAYHSNIDTLLFRAKFDKTRIIIVVTELQEGPENIFPCLLRSGP